jgi:carboxymethylenebutenolidase
MCFDTDALPPDPARTGMLAGTERSTLVAADGNRFAVTIARSRQDPAPGIVIIPDVRGLHPYYERLAEHVADAGIHAIALDPYGRTAGAHHREDGFEYREHRAAVRDAGIREDVRAAGDVLRGMGASSIVSMGFCFGGRASLMQGSQDGIDGVIAFYGPPTRGENGERSPLEEARSGVVRAPVLGLYGGADQGISTADVEAYEQALEAAGVDHRIVVFPGAPHSFFDRSMSEQAEACREAWSNVLGFVDSLGR